MSKFDNLYERTMRHVGGINLNRELDDKKPLTMVDGKTDIKVFGTVGGEIKELLSVPKGSVGSLRARNFIYKTTRLNYYMDGNRRVKLPYYDER
jgi:hypothetical protein